jgi:hypothetical protein
VLLLALVLRLLGLEGLTLFGDSASSVFFAMQAWTDIPAATALDSHPPGYYYLLRFSLELVGWNELGARLPSIFAGVLLVAVILGIARQLAGPGVGLAVGLLGALSPPLVVYSRQPRMYALLALLSVLLLALAARPNRSRVRQFILLALSLASLMTHYFAAVVVAAAAVLAAAGVLAAGPRPFPPVAMRPSRHTGGLRDTARALGRALWPYALAAALWAPWLAYALGESLRHTERTIAGVPPQPTLLHFFGSLGVAVSVGTFVPLLPSLGLAAAWWLVAGGVVAAARRWRGWPALAFGIIAACAGSIYLIQPAFGRPRFFLALVPLALLSLALPLRALRGSLRAAATLALATIALTGLLLTAPVERGTFELESVRLGEALAGSSPNDVVILQPWWQAGYLRTRLDPPPRLLALRDLAETAWPPLLEERRTIWLILSGVGRRDPAYPLEEWLDRRAYRVDEQPFGALRAVRYAVAPDPPPPEPLVFPNGLALAAVPALREVAAGEALPVLVRWEATRAVDERVVLFLHLRNADGSGWAGRDEEPDAGARLDGRWRAGDALLDRRGLVVPLWTPPGPYRLVAGLYRRSDGTRVGGELDLGEVRVARATVTARPRAVFDDTLALLSVRLVLPNPSAAKRTTIDTVDGPQTLVTPLAARPGETLSVLLTWRPERPLERVTAIVQVLDQQGRRVASRSSPPAGPSDLPESWTAGSVATGRFDLALPAELPAGTYRLRVGLTRQSGVPLTVNGEDGLDLGWVVVSDAG